MPDPDADLVCSTYSFIPEMRSLFTEIRAAAPRALHVVGGAGFSMLPDETMDALEIPLAVVGAGEAPFREIVIRHAAGRSLDGIPGVVRREDPDKLGRLVVGFLDRPVIRDERYAALPLNHYAVRTRFGCAMACSYCLVANLRRVNATAEVSVTLADIEHVIEIAGRHGLPRAPIIFSDEEINLPSNQSLVEILDQIVARGLADRIAWRGFAYPAPLSDELLRLVKATNGRMSITCDSAADAVRIRNKKPFRRRHLEELLRKLEAADLIEETVISFMFGLPGETADTMRETVDFIRAVPEGLRVRVQVGARVYPHTPLAALAAEEPDKLIGDTTGSGIMPLVFCSPDSPLQMVRELRDAFSDRPTVFTYDFQHILAPDFESRAYRLVRAPDTDAPTWNALLDECRDDHQYVDYLENLQALAIWYGRNDLGRIAGERLDAEGYAPSLGFRIT